MLESLETTCTTCNGTGNSPKQEGFWSKIMTLPCEKCHKGKVLTREGRELCKFIQRHMNYNDTGAGGLHIKGE